MPHPHDQVLLEAEFNRKVRSYWLLSGSIVCVATIVGIVLLPFWLLIGHFLTERYLQRMTCTLTERSLKVTRGILVRQEMTVPLDKITDVGLVEGPIMRFLDLQAVKVETAGQSATGAAVQLVGIVKAREFRDEVLRQRDRVSDRAAPENRVASGAAAPDQAMSAVLGDIRDTLHRIERRLPGGPDA